MRETWNERYEASEPSFAPHPLVDLALAAGLPDGVVLELACGPSGSALALAEAGRFVVAIDVSDVALAQLAAEAELRGLSGFITCIRADAADYALEEGAFALVLCTRFWDPEVYVAATSAVAPGGLLAWEALCETPEQTGQFRIPHGDLSSRLPAGFDVLAEDLTDDGRHPMTRLLARRRR